MIRLGLTGSIGAGKSTVARLLRERHGFPVLDADAVARHTTGEPAVLAEIEGAFGPEYVVDGVLDRPRLARLVFSDTGALARLNAIVHPRVRAELARQEAELAAAGAGVVVQDVPLLFENGLERHFDGVLLVDAPLETRLARVATRDGTGPEETRRRDAAQMPAEEKRRRTLAGNGAVLENGGDLESLAAQLEAALARLLAGRAP